MNYNSKTRMAFLSRRGVNMPLTIYCLGTGQSKADTLDISKRFYEKTTTPCLIFDGPPLAASDLLGRETIAKNVLDIEKKIEESIKNGDLKIDNDGSYRVNMTGFSRGAVTCLRVANRFKDKGDPFNKVKFNIYEIDPVAGLFDKSDINALRIPENVEQFVATVQTDEMRADFKPQDLSRVQVENYEKTQVTFLPLFGNHSGSNKIRKEKIQDCSIINYHLMHAFLSAHHTTFKDNKPPEIVSEVKDIVVSSAPSKLLNHYANAKLNREAYALTGRKLGSTMKSLPTLAALPRAFTRHIDDYVLDGAEFDYKGNLQKGFFVNQHERELLKSQYPETFNYLFEKGRSESGDNFKSYFALTSDEKAAKRNAVIKELRVISEINPLLFKQLTEHRGVKVEGVKIIIPTEPLGVSRIEHCHFLNRTPLTPLERLEKEVFQVTEQYHRGKNEWMTHAQRSKYELSQSIKEGIRNIMNEDISDQEKLQKSLNFIEQQCKGLRSIHSPSKLLPALESVLSKHGIRWESYERNVPVHENVAFYIGKGIRRFGSAMQRIARVAATFVGNSADMVESFGRRTFDFLNVKNKAGSALLAPFRWVLGKGMELIGKGLNLLAKKVIARSADPIKWLGNQLMSVARVSGGFAGGPKSTTSQVPEVKGTQEKAQETKMEDVNITFITTDELSQSKTVSEPSHRGISTTHRPSVSVSRSVSVSDVESDIETSQSIATVSAGVGSPVPSSDASPAATEGHDEDNENRSAPHP